MALHLGTLKMAPFKNLICIYFGRELGIEKKNNETKTLLSI